MWQFIIAGFGLGLISSLHCVGMCGPLAMSLPVYHLRKKQRIKSMLLYQLGRIITYTSLGLILGLAGRSIYLAGFQQWFSISAGILVLVLILAYWVFKKNVQPAFMKRFYFFIQKWMMVIFKKQKPFSFLLFGIANGLLPCGMVYMAIATALVTTKITYSALFMMMFGLGTLPAMFAISYFGQLFSMSARNAFRKAVPVFASVVAVILILRGLNLGIPFISPVMPKAISNEVMVCH